MKKSKDKKKKNYKIYITKNICIVWETEKKKR